MPYRPHLRRKKQEQPPEPVEEPKAAVPYLLTEVLAEYKELRKKEIKEISGDEK